MTIALRRASAEALTELGDALGRGRPTQDDLATLGSQLFEVARVFRDEGALRRFATDNAVEAEAKVGLVDSVLGSLLEERTLAVVRDAVQRRWTSAHDLPEALEQLAVTAVARSTGARGDRLDDELFAVERLVEQNPELRSALADPARDVAERRSLLTGLLDGKALPATQTLVAQAVGSARGPVATVLSDYQKLVAEASDEVVAVVRTARPLPDAEVERLATALGNQYAATIHVQVVEDPSLIGGLRVEIGDDVIDGSVSSRLDEARRKLAG